MITCAVLDVCTCCFSYAFYEHIENTPLLQNVFGLQYASQFNNFHDKDKCMQRQRSANIIYGITLGQLEQNRLHQFIIAFEHFTFMNICK